MTNEEILKLLETLGFVGEYYEEQLECNEQLLECLKSYYNCEYITKASIDFEKSCVHLTIAPPVSLERIKIDFVLAYKEND